jgi:hypothetical protein
MPCIPASRRSGGRERRTVADKQLSGIQRCCQMPHRMSGLHPTSDRRDTDLHATDCRGLRMPAMRTTPHAPTAGVGKAAMHEVAEGGALSERLYGDLAWLDGTVDRAVAANCVDRRRQERRLGRLGAWRTCSVAGPGCLIGRDFLHRGKRQHRRWSTSCEPEHRFGWRAMRVIMRCRSRPSAVSRSACTWARSRVRRSR